MRIAILTSPPRTRLLTSVKKLSMTVKGRSPCRGGELSSFTTAKRFPSGVTSKLRVKPTA